MWDECIAKLQLLLELMQQKYLGNRLLDYAWSAAILFALFLLLWLLRTILFRRLSNNVGQQTTPRGQFFVTTCNKTLQPLLYFAAFYLSMYNLDKHPTLTKGIAVIGIIVVTLVTIAFLVRLLEYLLTARRQESTRNVLSHGLFTLLKAAIWGFGIIFLLDNLGFKISTIIAGLGIGGIAMALAAQTILGDLFNYFVILFDKPFDIGDFIAIDDCMGTVENIGIKTTRIRSLGGEELVMANTDLTRSRLRNYKKMEIRRVNFQLGVPYQTSYEQLKAIPDIIAGVVRSIPNTRFDSAHFASYETSSLKFEIVYHVLTNDYNKYIDIQQEINLAIKQQFQKQGIEFAYPTQTLYVK